MERALRNLGSFSDQDEKKRKECPALFNFASVFKLWPLLQKESFALTISNFRRL